MEVLVIFHYRYSWLQNNHTAFRKKFLRHLLAYFVSVKRKKKGKKKERTSKKEARESYVIFTVLKLLLIVINTQEDASVKILYSLQWIKIRTKAVLGSSRERRKKLYFSTSSGKMTTHTFWMASQCCFIPLPGVTSGFFSVRTRWATVDILGYIFHVRTPTSACSLFHAPTKKSTPCSYKKHIWYVRLKPIHSS